MKASFDVNVIKEFCVQHVEKFVFGGVVLGLVFLAYGATSVKNVDFTPEQLATSAEAAKENLEQTDPEAWKGEENVKVPPYSELVVGRSVKKKFYETEVPWLEPPLPAPPKRDDPPVFNVEELRATPGHGMFNVIVSAMASGGTPMTPANLPDRGRRWVVLTALLPYKKQAEAYKTAFPSAGFSDPRRDTPMYYYYLVQRAELGASGDAQALKWETIDPIQRLGEAYQYWRPMNDVVHQIYLARQWHRWVSMAFPLGPCVKGWDDEVAHPPEIPLAVDMPRPERPTTPTFPGLPGMFQPGVGGAKDEEGVESTGEEKEEGGEGPEAPFIGPGGPFGGAGAPFTGRGMPFSGPGPAMPGPSGPMMSGPSAPMMSGPSAPMMSGPSAPMMSGPSAPMMSSDTPMASGPGMSAPFPSAGLGGMGPSGLVTGMPEVEYKLFRFFDFDVQPGKRYQYRVRLYLINPNWQVPVQFLEREELAEKPVVWTKEWSEPSNVIAVPRDSRLLVGSVDPERSTSARGSLPAGSLNPTFTSTQGADVLAVTFKMEDGTETANKFSIARGQLANLEGKIVQQTPGRGAYPGPGSAPMMSAPMMSAPMMSGPPMGGPPGRPPTGQEEDETFMHATGMLVLDITGGDRLYGGSQDLSEPGSLLLMDPNGNLVVHNELDDLTEFTAHNVPEETRGRGRPKERPSMPGEAGFQYSDDGMYQMYDADDAAYRSMGRGSGRKSRRPRRRPD